MKFLSESNWLAPMMVLAVVAAAGCGGSSSDNLLSGSIIKSVVIEPPPERIDTVESDGHSWTFFSLPSGGGTTLHLIHRGYLDVPADNSAAWAGRLAREERIHESLEHNIKARIESEVR